MSVRKNTDPAAGVAQDANRDKDQHADDAARDGHRDPVMEAAAEGRGKHRDKNREPSAATKEAAEANARTGPDGLTTVDREQKYGVVPEMSGPGGLPGTERDDDRF
jgi:hypothetical protein